EERSEWTEYQEKLPLRIKQEEEKNLKKELAFKIRYYDSMKNFSRIPPLVKKLLQLENLSEQERSKWTEYQENLSIKIKQKSDLKQKDQLIKQINQLDLTNNLSEILPLIQELLQIEGLSNYERAKWLKYQEQLPLRIQREAERKKRREKEKIDTKREDKSCSECGTVISPQWKFCKKCGAKTTMENDYNDK
ncbi:MAG: zinc ribbon domain-containing protein, partial [Promethearchaeota archaeon]